MNIQYRLFDKVVNKDLKAVLNLNIVLLYITVFFNRCQVKKNMLYCNFTKSIELATQGAWTRWNLPKRTITCELWRLEPFRISFLLRAVYDTLPTPVNLHRWGTREDPLCRLCGGKGTMAHILSGCKIALTQGRYRWRHDKVLAVLADILEQERNNQPKQNHC